MRLAKALDVLVNRAVLVGSRGRSLHYGRPEPQDLRLSETRVALDPLLLGDARS